ncbi:MAG TPA: hypothetical protein ENF94_01425 [Candidatus Woesearchaeota archaeon]|nr:MAG: hypothetical protein DRJ25_03430 [Candidatus Woesearchaeota archaeon]HDD70801.1 hypothetical protein [Candidatus Woesearchaeota archaeon]
MKTLIFDSGPIISLALSNLLWILPELKKRFKGRFIIPAGVRNELIDVPLKGKKFRLEAIQLLNLIEKKVLEVVDDKKVTEKAKQLVDEANRIFKGFHHNIRIIQTGEMEAMAMAELYNADGVVVDERITRTLIEHPYGLRKHMERKLHTRLSVDKRLLEKLSDELDDVYIIRSTELVAVAFELGILDKYLLSKRVSRKDILESALWAVKLRGCSVSEDEIDKIVKEEI